MPPVVSVTVRSCPSRSTRSESGASGAAATTRWRSSKRGVGVPPMDRMRSPTTSPPRSAAPPGTRRDTSGSSTCRPTMANSAANSTKASRKFAIGPAATTMAREPTLFSQKVRPRR